MDLSGRIVLVTGAARRVGRAIAMDVAAHGARIALHYHGSETAAKETQRAIIAQGGEAELFQADLRDASMAEQLIASVVDRMGALDALVNSAAVMQRTPLGSVTADAWDAMFALNLRAPFFLAQAAAPYLRGAAETRRENGEGERGAALAQSHTQSHTQAHTQSSQAQSVQASPSQVRPSGAQPIKKAVSRTGAIVNIADLAAFETWPAYIPHSVTKAGVVQMTRALARALAPDVRVNAVAPGAVLLPDDWDEAAARRMNETTPLKRLGSPADVAQAVLYLLQAEYVTGEVIVVDGGRHVKT